MTSHDSIIAELALHRLIIRGLLRPPTMLEPADLAERSGLSSASWRDALHRLAGQGMIKQVNAACFALPRADGAMFLHLLDWQERLALSALARRRRPMARMAFPGKDGDPRCPGLLFVELAATTASTFLERAMTRATAGLARYRASEAAFIEDLADEYAAFRRDLVSGDQACAQAAIREYHDRRRRLASSLIASAGAICAQSVTARSSIPRDSSLQT